MEGMPVIKTFDGVSDDLKELFYELAEKTGLEIKGCIHNHLNKNCNLEVSGAAAQFMFFEYLFKKYGACLAYIAKQLD